MSHYVYRLFAADGVLLYVGRTNDFAVRLDQHRHPWTASHPTSWDFYDLIDHWSVEDVGTKARAMRVEAEAISAESPLFNVWRPGVSGQIASRWRAATQPWSEMEIVLARFAEPIGMSP